MGAAVSSKAAYMPLFSAWAHRAGQYRAGTRWAGTISAPPSQYAIKYTPLAV